MDQTEKTFLRVAVGQRILTAKKAGKLFEMKLSDLLAEFEKPLTYEFNTQLNLALCEEQRPEPPAPPEQHPPDPRQP